MPGVIVILILAVVGFFIYQSLPSTKFTKASNLFSAGNLPEAINILSLIFDKHPEAPAKFSECKLKQGLNLKTDNENEAISFFNQVIDIQQRLPNNANKSSYELIKAKAYFEIALINFRNIIKVSIVEDKIKKLNENINYIDNATQKEIEKDFFALRNRHSSELADIFFKFGIENEKSKKYLDALQNYSKARDYAKQDISSKTRHNSITRINICKLKTSEVVEQSSFDSANYSLFEYKRDFYYRYTVQLLKNKNFQEAEKIISEQLNDSSKEIEKLKQVIQNEKIKLAIEKVNEINNALENLFNNKYPIKETKDFYDSIDKYTEEIKTIIPSITNKLQELKPSFFKRLLTLYISGEQFANAINLIQKFPSFWESPELLKNLGICSYHYTSKINLTDKTYRIVISNWLTSVFSDKIILNSLETTSWDDDFSFTLIDAIGSNYQQHSEIPDNANYDEITDTNISIGATQKELLQQFESVLHNTISDPSFAKEVSDYYTGEKEAIEKIVAVINNDILFAAPHFAKSYGINEEIIRELDSDYSQYSNEESLDAGIPYLKSNADTYVREYAAAKELVSKIVSSIKNEKLSDLKEVAGDRKKSLIEKYDTINNSLEDLIYNAFVLKIEENDVNENLLPMMDECIRLIKENEKLKVQCSSFIYEYCHSKWKKAKPEKLLELMIKSMKYNLNNYRAAKSITILINNNLMDIANDATNSVSQIYSLIEDVKKIKSEVLKDALKELAILRNKTLASLGTEASKTLLLGYNLNTDGMKLKKIIDTMGALSGVNTTSNPINRFL